MERIPPQLTGLREGDLLRELPEKRQRLIRNILMRKPYRDDVRLSIKLANVLMQAPEPILKEVDFDSRRNLFTDLDEIGRAVETFGDFVYLRLRFPKRLLSSTILILRNSNRGFNQNIISVFETLKDGGKII